MPLSLLGLSSGESKLRLCLKSRPPLLLCYFRLVLSSERLSFSEMLPPTTTVHHRKRTVVYHHASQDLQAFILARSQGDERTLSGFGDALPINKSFFFLQLAATESPR